MKNIFFVSLFLLLTCVSCKDKAPSSAETDMSAVGQESAVQHLGNSEITTVFKAGSAEYTVTVSCHTDTSLNQVVDVLDNPYYDNCAEITILRNGEEWYKKTFNKSDFASRLTQQEMKQCALIGFAFEEDESTPQTLQFSCKLGIPGPEDGPAFIVQISTSDHSIAVKVDDRQVDMGEENLI